MTTTQTGAPPGGVTLTTEDIALLADGTGNIPDDTARRLQVLICCGDVEQIVALWRYLAAELVILRRLADAVRVALLADGLHYYRCVERLRAEIWKTPADVFDPRTELHYPELISVARYLAGRAEGEERAELEHLAGRLEHARDQPQPATLRGACHAAETRH